MIFVDSGYLIALFDRRDELHSRAVAWSLVLDERLLVTDYVLLETANFFSSPARRSKSQAIWDMLTGDAQCEFLLVDWDLLKAAMRFYGDRRDKAWSLTDCVSFVVMKQRGIRQALAHDEHFEQAGFEALLRREP